MAVGSITHPTYGVQSFLVMATDTGWPIDQFNVDEEEMRASGVDGKRWRTLSVQHQPITMQTVADDTTYALCISKARTYRKFKSGDPVIVSVAIAGVTYTFRTVHVLDVSPQVAAGGVYGSGAASGSAAHVLATWQLILMDTAVTGEPV